MYQAYKLIVSILVIAHGGTALAQCDCEELFCSPGHQPCADTEVMSLNETVVTLTEELADMSIERDNLQAQVSTLTAEREALQSQIDEIGGDIDALVQERDTAVAENATLTENLASVTSERDTARAENVTLNGNLASVTAERNALTSERDALTAERDALTAERDALTAERDKFLAGHVSWRSAAMDLAIAEDQGFVSPDAFDDVCALAVRMGGYCVDTRGAATVDYPPPLDGVVYVNTSLPPFTGGQLWWKSNNDYWEWEFRSTYGVFPFEGRWRKIVDDSGTNVAHAIGSVAVYNAGQDIWVKFGNLGGVFAFIP